MDKVLFGIALTPPKVGVNNPQKESQIFADSMLFFAKNLLSHAKVLEDVSKNFIRCNLATCDFSKVSENGM